MPQSVKVGIFMTVALVLLGWLILRVEDWSFFGEEGERVVHLVAHADLEGGQVLRAQRRAQAVRTEGADRHGEPRQDRSQPEEGTHGRRGQ